MSYPKHIGVLTGGGDCPGLNAVIRAVTKDALFHGIRVTGIEDGFLGLIERRARPLDETSVSDILSSGGTVLGSSNKANPQRFATGTDDSGNVIWEDVTEGCIDFMRRLGLEALVVIGGDGTMTCAAPFVEAGINCIGVPKTIDNDLHGTDLTFGFLTAVHVATEAMDRVRTTAASHHRVMVVEVMGRNAGWIALHSGVASGADVILIPEIEFDVDKICASIEDRSRKGKKYSIVCVAEGSKPKGGEQIVHRVDPTSPDPIRLGGIADWLMRKIEEKTKIESRHVVLGHTQRGGTPVASDRVLATQFGHHAMELLKGNTQGRMVAMQGLKLTDIPMLECAGKQRLVPLDHHLVAAARSVHTSFGD